MSSVPSRSRRPVDGFIPALFGTVLLAFLWPGPGSSHGVLPPARIAHFGVAVIFFLQGLTLSFPALRAGASAWRLHLLVQGTTFLLFPLLGLLVYLVPDRWAEPELKLGFFFLCALPSTVSSSIAFTAAAGGNVPGAVFNATVSNLLGLVLTPFWVGLVAQVGATPLPSSQVLGDLLLWLGLPLVLGQLARPALGPWAAGHPGLVRAIDRGIILLLVYTSFCQSIEKGVWRQHSFALLGVTLLGAGLLFGLVCAFLLVFTRALNFSLPDRIAGIFCGSKKSLATGLPLAQIIFAHQPALGLLVLPTLIYHPLQLIACAFLAARWAGQRRVTEI